MRHSAITYFLLLTAIIVAGCATIEEEKRMETLSKTTEKYRSAIRWRLYETAENLTETSDNTEHSDLDRLKKIKVTAYKTVKKNISDDGTEARQTIEIKYFHTDYLVEKTIIDKQLWKYDPGQNRWHLQSGLPEFK